MSACRNCGRELTHIVDERGERWVHTVEPTGHEAIPDEAVALGRARAIAEVGYAAEFQAERGATVDFAWLQMWVRYHGHAEALSTREEDNAAFKAAMEARRATR